MMGTCTTPKRRTRPTDVQKAVFWKTRRYCWNPPNTSRASPKVPSRSTTSSDCQTA
jgi:hypothetical protein